MSERETYERRLHGVDTFAVLQQRLNTVRMEKGLSVRFLTQENNLTFLRADQIFDGIRVPSREDFAVILNGLGIHGDDQQPWKDAYIRAERQRPIVNVGGRNNIITVQSGGNQTINQDTNPTTSQQRQAFFFKFLNSSLRLTTTTFVLALLFTSAAAIVTLWGAVLMVANIGGTFDYAPLLTTLSGLVVAAGGGALTVHAYKARNHITAEAKEVRQDIRDDTAFERATKLIALVQDPQLKDHLLSLTAAKELGLAPSPIEMSDLPQPKRIEVERVHRPDESP
ncbi:hypothetical protein AB0H71_29980 [Nocardia sp. NPDC050697]|uniref:TRADD-N-associated membrane domain-containing protein n=1 Tax=Nocardia sp. NPDC050697 TaxID=3155158 RepID=UPI0033F8CEED